MKKKRFYVFTGEPRVRSLESPGYLRFKYPRVAGPFETQQSAEQTIARLRKTHSRLNLYVEEY